MKKSFWNAEKIISFAAIFISLITLFVFIYQTNLMRKQQYLSVLPYLSVGIENGFSPDYKLVLTNNGIGPAFIESVRVKYEGKEYDKDLPSLLLSIDVGFDTLSSVSYSNIYAGRMIPAGERVEILAVDNSLEDARLLLKILADLQENGFDFELIYRSIYEEKWRLTANSTVPEKI